VVDPSVAGKFALIPPGVNLEIFGRDSTSPAEEKTAARVSRMLERDLPENRRELPVVICSSRLDRKKNHLGLVRAWAESETLRRAVNLTVVTRGVVDPLQSWERDFKGEEREVFGEIVRLIRQFGLQGCVSAFDLNSQEELAACYRYLARRRRGIFALSSTYEPFGLAPLEAMAAGLPAVVTRNGGPKESLRDEGGEYGVLIDPEDPSNIAEGILKLAGDESRRREMAVRGHRRVLDRYTWRRTAEGYLRELSVIRRKAGADGGKPSTAPTRGGRDWLESAYFENGGSE
jgi:sucrose-phosphate synthase